MFLISFSCANWRSIPIIYVVCAHIFETPHAGFITQSFHLQARDNPDDITTTSSWLFSKTRNLSPEPQKTLCNCFHRLGSTNHDK